MSKKASKKNEVQVEWEEYFVTMAEVKLAKSLYQGAVKDAKDSRLSPSMQKERQEIVARHKSDYEYVVGLYNQQIVTGKPAGRRPR